VDVLADFTDFLQLFCPAKQFISRLIFEKGVTRLNGNGRDDWDDMKFHIECRSFRSADTVGSSSCQYVNTDAGQRELCGATAYELARLGDPVRRHRAVVLV
jgi:hypothetical protein